MLSTLTAITPSLIPGQKSGFWDSILNSSTAIVAVRVRVDNSMAIQGGDPTAIQVQFIQVNCHVALTINFYMGKSVNSALLYSCITGSSNPATSVEASSCSDAAL